jgi:ElaB/YqjD/DUF883 family membrane-anchored ribosome-binding protein
METTNDPNSCCSRDADIAAATAHVKESWEHGKEAACDAQRIARNGLADLSRSVDHYFETRPKSVAFWALGTGLAIGVLTGLLVSRAVRSPCATA